VTAKQNTRCKFIVRLSEEERERLKKLMQNGKHGARQLLKARVLLKADASDAGAGWSDTQHLNLTSRSNGSFRPEANASFVANMEDVLEVYQRPHDPARPVVCLDKTSKQLISETRVPIAAKPGRPARHDYEYERNGTANLFMMFAPLEGWQQVKVTDHHAAVDYARVLKDLADTHFPNAAQIVLVQDNLSTHKPASLYQAFPAAEARRLVERFEWHYTPTHDSWLDMAEPEISVLSRRCLNRRIRNKQALIEEVAAWQASRNKRHIKADWQFTTADARVKLRRLYPAI
jgi:hypothetical protein